MILKAKPLSIIVVVLLFSSITVANIIGRWDSELKPQGAVLIMIDTLQANLPR